MCWIKWRHIKTVRVCCLVFLCSSYLLTFVVSHDIRVIFITLGGHFSEIYLTLFGIYVLNLAGTHYYLPVAIIFWAVYFVGFEFWIYLDDPNRSLDDQRLFGIDSDVEKLSTALTLDHTQISNIFQMLYLVILLSFIVIEARRLWKLKSR